jgi:type III secretion system YscD/HrpQ family protein
VIFSNEDVADRHVKLVLSEGGVRLRPLAQPVYVEGKDIGLHDVTLLPYQLVTIGKVGFALGDGSGRWPKVDIHGRKYQANLERNITNKTTTSGWKKWLFWLGLAVLIIANLHYFNRDDGGIFTAFGLKETIEEEVYSAIGDAGLSGISVTKTPTGRIKVSGYVATDEQKHHLIKKILEVNGEVSHTIWVNSNIENNALLIAKTLGEEQLQFSSKEDGVLVASGHTQSQANWRKVRINLLEDIEGIESIDDTHVKSVLERLKQEVLKQDLAEKIQLQQKQKKIVVSGSPNQAQIKQWHNLLSKMIRPVDGYWEIVETFSASKDEKEFKLSLRSVSVGAVPFIVSKDGKKYLEGAHLGEGYYIKKIMAEQVLLTYKETEIPVYFGKKGDSK